MSKLENKSLETLTADLVQGIEDVNNLNLAREVQRNAFLNAIEKRPSLLTKVDEGNGPHFLRYAMEKDFELFVHLKRCQYFDEIAQIYLFNRLTGSSSRKGAKSETGNSGDFIVQKSVDEKTLLTYVYTTPEGEEICYYDTQLGIPLSLKSCVKFTLKIKDAVKLIDKIDMNVAYLGEKKIKSLIGEMIACEYTSYLTQFITTQSAGYYALCTSFADIEAGVQKQISNTLSDYGIAVTSIVIKRIAIPKDIQNKIEDQAFILRQRKAEVEADAELAQLSLKNYEAKLAVHQKYPEAELTLTEYEKDQALKRYLIKRGREDKEEINRAISIKKIVEQGDAAIEKKADIIPDIVPKKNKFKTSFFTLLLLSLSVFFIILASEATGAAFIFLSFVCFTFGPVAALNIEKFKNVEIEPEVELAGEKEVYKYE